MGLAETERGDWTVRFMQVELGRIDRQTRASLPRRGTADGSAERRSAAVEMPSPWTSQNDAHR